MPGQFPVKVDIQPAKAYMLPWIDGVQYVAHEHEPNVWTLYRREGGFLFSIGKASKQADNTWLATCGDQQALKRRLKNAFKWIVQVWSETQ